MLRCFPVVLPASCSWTSQSCVVQVPRTARSDPASKTDDSTDSSDSTSCATFHVLPGLIAIQVGRSQGRSLFCRCRQACKLCFFGGGNHQRVPQSMDINIAECQSLFLLSRCCAVRWLQHWTARTRYVIAELSSIRLENQFADVSWHGVLSVGLSTGPFVGKIRHRDSQLLDLAGVDLPTCLRLLMSTCWHSGMWPAFWYFRLGTWFLLRIWLWYVSTRASFTRTVAATNIPWNDVSLSQTR